MEPGFQDGLPQSWAGHTVRHDPLTSGEDGWCPRAPQRKGTTSHLAGDQRSAKGRPGDARGASDAAAGRTASSEPGRSWHWPHTAASRARLTGPQIQCKHNRVYSFQVLSFKTCANIGHTGNKTDVVADLVVSQSRGSRAASPWSQPGFLFPIPGSGADVRRCSKPGSEPSRLPLCGSCVHPSWV